MPNEAQQNEARKELRKYLKPGTTVYTVLKNVSSSGMSRSIQLLVPYTRIEEIYPLKADGRRDYDAKPKRKRHADVRDISWLAARLMGDKLDEKRGGIRTHGCGMDMGFNLVYNLGSYMWPNGTRKPHGTRNGDPDTTGGYALNHRWL